MKLQINLPKIAKETIDAKPETFVIDEFGMVWEMVPQPDGARPTLRLREDHEIAEKLVKSFGTGLTTNCVVMTDLNMLWDYLVAVQEAGKWPGEGRDNDGIPS